MSTPAEPNEPASPNEAAPPEPPPAPAVPPDADDPSTDTSDGADDDGPAPPSAAPDAAPPSPPAHVHAHGRPQSLNYRLALSLAALGVVYGDIGTSPLYALRECFHHIAPTHANVLGILSLVFWSLIIVISVKYIAFVMRADNAGEGGILSLMTLATKIEPGVPRKPVQPLLVALGLFGAALLYGDGIITPAISVLSAVEGLEVVTPVFTPYVIPITIAVLVGVFAVQRRGTAGIGRIFGPVTMLWFAVLGVLGIMSIIEHPTVLAAVNPMHAVHFFGHNGIAGFLVLGSVALVVTGGESLYLDMGHFGRWPIRFAWFAVVLPSLLLNYFGQGALMLVNPEAAENPLFYLAPSWAVLPLVILATMATVIASQAVITGAFSLTMQGVQLGYLPRVRVFHTSKTEYGQVYVPSINAALMVACLTLVLTFRSSTALAAAYGIAVMTTMSITSILLFVVMRTRWRWPMWTALPLIAGFLLFDLSFFGANIVKVAKGGWVPLVLAVAVFTVMTTWRRGRQILSERMAEGALPLELALPDLARSATRVRGTAVYMHGNPTTTPPALLHNLKHNKVLHDRVIFLRVEVLASSHVGTEDRCSVGHITDEFYRVTLRYGFAEVPDVATDLECSTFGNKPIKRMETTYFLGRERLFSTDRPGMMEWRERLFSAMSNNAGSAVDFFGLPPNQVVEIGARVEI